jgi:hypothetical protein
MWMEIELCGLVKSTKLVQGYMGDKEDKWLICTGFEVQLELSYKSSTLIQVYNTPVLGIL